MIILLETIKLFKKKNPLALNNPTRIDMPLNKQTKQSEYNQ